MSRYKEVSEQVFEIFHRFTPLVEALSIDEAFLDVTGSGRLLGGPVKIAQMIKQTVFDETGLTVSAGVAPSKFVAKIASDMEKPDGLTVVSLDRVQDFLNPLPIKKMWGVGKVTQEALALLNVRTFRDLSRLPVHVLERKFGAHGRKMHALSQGIDDREVIPEHEVKSIGHEETFSEDIMDLDAAKKELLALSNRVARRMRRHDFTGKTITLKVKTTDFILKTRSTTLPESTDDGLEIYRTVCRLLKKTPVGKSPVRLLGVSLSHLEGPEMSQQLFLFEEENAAKRKQLNKALDALLDKHGNESIRPGTLVDEKK